MPATDACNRRYPGAAGAVKIGIAIDPWKLTIFERHLSQAGYAFDKSNGRGFLLLTVVTENKDALEATVRAANSEAAITRGREV